MKSLFLKIFLSFWMAQALFLALAMVAAIAFRPQTESPHWEYIRNNTAAETVNAYEVGGQNRLRAKLNEVDRGLRIHVFLFDQKGNELSGRPVPAWAEDLARGQQQRYIPLLEWFSPRRLVTQPVAGANGDEYTIVMEVPPRPLFPLLREHPPGTGLLLAILTSGIVCYFLARYLTSPVRRLRSATQRLAAGELSSRADEPPAHRRDEIAELVRDFNTMAGRLESLVGAQAQLLKDISHELRSPLARLNVALGLARQRAGVEAQEVLERIELEANRLNELIGRLLTLARLEGGEDSASRAPFSLNEQVEDITEDADFEAQGRNRRVRCEIHDEAILVGSPALVHSAIENVVRNATRHTAEDTEVVIQMSREVRGEHSEAVVRVIDCGPGVPESSLGKLFHPFYRIDDSRGRQTGGVGLGLSITERAVRLHGGSVRAMNRPQGGLEIEMRFPLDPNLQPAAIENPAVETTASP
jgi:two-component system sensor histidine kinase CpxA